MKTKAQSSVIYRGPSLLDGAPIVVIAIVQSGNIKTGNMVQTHILRADIAPLEASKTGADFSICGNCPHRGVANSDPMKKQAKERTCYVNIGQGPTVVWKKFQRGGYPFANGIDAVAAIGAGRMVRLGTYGDPSAVPSEIWDALLRDSAGRTGYTHQANVAGADVRPDLCMTSADTEADARDAWARGERTFRIIASTSDIVKGSEALCPASKEGGFKTTCDKCKLCSGNTINARSIAIVAHGSGAKYFAA